MFVLNIEIQTKQIAPSDVRRAETEREHHAFLWFFGTFLESVRGARSWRVAKKTMSVSEATDETGDKLVTKSD
jgi:hypothetical protein